MRFGCCFRFGAPSFAGACFEFGSFTCVCCGSGASGRLEESPASTIKEAKSRAVAACCENAKVHAAKTQPHKDNLRKRPIHSPEPASLDRFKMPRPSQSLDALQTVRGNAEQQSRGSKSLSVTGYLMLRKTAN